MRRRIIAAALIAGAALIHPPKANALFGIGDVVIDPANLVQNIQTAASTLEQINNQVRQLQNEANMLIGQAKDLAALDHSSLEELITILERLDELLRGGDEITYEVEKSEERYKEAFPESYEDLTSDEIVVRASRQWEVSRASFGNAIRVQSAIITSIGESRDTLSTLVQKSQGAEGNLAAAQAGNQLIALSVEQQMQMQTLMTAHYRMLAVEQAREAAIEQQAREHHQRFRGDGSAYTRK